MNSLMTVFLLILIILSSKDAQARSVIFPKRETAVIYFLTLTDVRSNKSMILESKKAEFVIPDNLEGDYSLQISFSDKWGRKIEGQEPKIIKLVNKKEVREAIVSHHEQQSAPLPLIGIVFYPYNASGTYTADLNDPSTSLKKGSSTFSSTGVKTILKINAVKKIRFGIDYMKSSNPKKSLSSTEASIIYDWFQTKKEKNEKMVGVGIASAATQIKGQFSDGSSLINSSAVASSAYIFGQFFYSHHFSRFHLETLGMFGASPNYLRYDLGQSMLYTVSNRWQIGPWINYGILENGTKEGAIKATMLKLGLNLNLNL